MPVNLLRVEFFVQCVSMGMVPDRPVPNYSVGIKSNNVFFRPRLPQGAGAKNKPIWGIGNRKSRVNLPLKCRPLGRASSLASPINRSLRQTEFVVFLAPRTNVGLLIPWCAALEQCNANTIPSLSNPYGWRAFIL